MKKLKGILSLLVLIVVIAGCSQQQNEGRYEQKENAPDFKQRLDISSNFVSEDKDYIIADIIIKIPGKATLLPSGVFIQPFTRTFQGNTEVIKDVPNLLIEAVSQIDSGKNNKFSYQVTIPKSVFNLTNNMARDSVHIKVRGYFLNKDGNILSNVNGIGTLKLKSTHRNNFS